MIKAIKRYSFLSRDSSNDSRAVAALPKRLVYNNKIAMTNNMKQNKRPQRRESLAVEEQ